MSEKFDPRELIASLSRNGVDFVTIGGVAVQAHGGQRMTQDLDVAIGFSSGNVTRLARSLEELDARVLGPEGQRSNEVPSARMLSAGDQWHLVTIHGRLDIVTVPAHLGSFAEMRERAHEVRLGEIVVPIASRGDLLTLKRASGRPQDLADVELLESLEEGA